jgi:hypothetical protein
MARIVVSSAIARYGGRAIPTVKVESAQNGRSPLGDVALSAFVSDIRPQTLEHRDSDTTSGTAPVAAIIA